MAKQSPEVTPLRRIAKQASGSLALFLSVWQPGTMVTRSLMQQPSALGGPSRTLLTTSFSSTKQSTRRRHGPRALRWRWK
jgi:hypothetical protein